MPLRGYLALLSPGKGLNLGTLWTLFDAFQFGKKSGRRNRADALIGHNDIIKTDLARTSLSRFGLIGLYPEEIDGQFRGAPPPKPFKCRTRIGVRLPPAACPSPFGKSRAKMGDNLPISPEKISVNPKGLGPIG